MKLGSRNLIASYVNSNGVRVFIPERIKYNGETYVIPYRFNTYKVSQRENTIFSTKSKLQINIEFTNAEITASDAFTESTLNSVIRYVISSPSKSSSSLFSISKSEYEALL